jgi:hypothetical protein
MTGAPARVNSRCETGRPPAAGQSLTIKQELAINGARSSKRRELFVAVYERKISSAVSTVLRVQGFPVADAAGAEHCGYGDLQ